MRDILNFFERGFGIVGFVVNVVLVLLFVAVAYHSYARADFYFHALMPLPGLSVTEIMAYFYPGQLVNRLISVTFLWVFAILAAGRLGCLCLA